MKRQPRRVTFVLFVSVLLTAAGCGGTNDLSGPSSATNSTSLSFTSDAGDYIGQGETHRYTLSDGAWDARADPTTGEISHVSVYVHPATGPYAWWWQLNLSAPPGQALKVGTYENARRYPFNNAQPGLDFSGTARGCNTSTGRFVITQLQFGPGNTLERLQATFEQHCEGSSPALKGQIVVVANPWR
jgi:hypothetical protein